MSNEPTTLLEAAKYFADPQNCIDYVVARRWPNGVTCPVCGEPVTCYLKSVSRFQCSKRHAKRQFTVKTGTIFEDSPLPLEKWLIAMWLIVNAKNGISSFEVHRAVGVTQKTAWFLLHRIRYAMDHGFTGKLSGEIEADETFIGGKAINMHKDKKEARGYMDGGFGKTIVLGIKERGGRMVCFVVKDRTGRTIKPLVEKTVAHGSTIYTDLHGAYHGLFRNYNHGVVDHEAAYVWGPIHTNGCEGFWSLVKRSMRGTYVSVEPVHLHRYMAEYSFRYNERKTNDSGRFQTVTSRFAGKRLTYKQLTGKSLSAAE